ncbi:glycoside hydrolase family 27 protein [Arachidicoccus ginsenosidimutans]|uniref:glycoside hydrolase family 27 protein n=1 Tax=Arachidicoccus sp. BS20 TaxID=1850526 RepID=UPI0009ED2F2A|nr:glycoside hydrolase family 27 protein [Arachidicoccus sp. BS20]
MKQKITGTKLFLLLIFLVMKNPIVSAQILDTSFLRIKNVLTPPMGWMTWNGFGENINEGIIKEMADALVSSGMADAGYNYIFIDDGWQGGRDNKNNIIPDVKKFPSGIKALADYVHAKGLKLGIYSDAAPLTCAGYTGSLNFEKQDAATFASWGIDYLKYDYCNAPSDMATAKERYKAIADALSESGRNIVLGICEWGGRQPWLWAAQAGGTIWRISGDIRDKWKDKGQGGMGIMDIVDINGGLDEYAGRGRWNDPDMLVVGLNGVKGPAADLGGTGCSDTEYQSQMSLWCILSSPLIASNDLRKMDARAKEILTNKEAIAINQDALGKQGKRLVNNDDWAIFVKPLSNGDIAVAILNKSDKQQKMNVLFGDLSLSGNYEIRDLWEHRVIGKGNKWKGEVASHETKLFRLKVIK